MPRSAVSPHRWPSRESLCGERDDYGESVAAETWAEASKFAQNRTVHAAAIQRRPNETGGHEWTPNAGDGLTTGHTYLNNLQPAKCGTNEQCVVICFAFAPEERP